MTVADEIAQDDGDYYYEIENGIKKELIRKVKNSDNDYCYELDGVSCPICSEYVLASFTWKREKNDWCYNQLMPVCCYKCNYIISDSDLIKVFFEPQLSKELISRLESDNPPLAE